MNTSLSSQFVSFLKKWINTLYFQGRESFLGHQKRDIVVVHVNRACNSLQETSEQFEDALQQFKDIVSIEESTLEHRYKLLRRQFEFCRLKSDEVSNRIALIEEASASLFKEWEGELGQYSNRALRARSRQQLKTSHKQYNRLIKTMRKAESRIRPVLSAFKDQVLFLKHNLNAQAIATLQNEFMEIEIDISLLIEVMEATINEASQFVSALVDQKALPSP